jgi:heme A synthase
LFLLGEEMKRNTALKILNPILGILLVNQIATGLLRTKMSYEAFEILHEGAGVVLAGLVVLHLILNFNWIKANYFNAHKPT